MPQVFKLGSYWVYFWTNENKPIEPRSFEIINKWELYFNTVDFYC